MKTLKQIIYFKIEPEYVYDAFMNPKKHSAFTGDSAKISPKAGGKFSVFGGYATGKNLELVKDKKIVQTWKASDWPANADSKITLELMKDKKGTKLIFTQIHIPDDQYISIKQGWTDYYWNAMKKTFGW